MTNVETIEQKVQRIADYYGFDKQLNQVIEECGELIQAAAKYNRVKGEGYDTSINMEVAAENLVEELADVQLVIRQLIYLIDCHDAIVDITEEKANRQLERIKKRDRQP